MFGRRRICVTAVIAVMLLSLIVVFVSEKAQAASWLTTTDTDFSQGDFLVGGGFETVLHDTGVAAYVQNKKDMPNWIEKFPAANPGRRSYMGLTNDSEESRFVLFGGLDGISQQHNDTWEYDYATSNWERICSDNTPACPPPKRMAPSMAYDNNSKVVVMYGGIDQDNFIYLNDTWEYHVNNNTWVNRTAGTRPQDLSSHSIVYDAKDKRMILVGNGGGSMQVWAYDASTHMWIQRNPPSSPSARDGFALGYSYQANHLRIVLFGGSTFSGALADTWEYNYATNSWSQTTPATSPPGRSGTTMVYTFKSSMAGLILWGGSDWSIDTWRYYWNGATPTWARLSTSVKPPARYAHGMAYDPAHTALMLYGGKPQIGQSYNETWFLEDGYKPGGRYLKYFLDTHESNTTWKYIFWNQTPSALPPSTYIRFQVNWSNVCDNSDLGVVWRGPGGSTFTYYETPGNDVIGVTGFKCFRWLADMYTPDPANAPRLEDVTIIYEVGSPKPPKVDSVSPTMFFNPLDSHIYINFSKPMDTSNVWVYVQEFVTKQNVTLDTPWIWASANSELEITHNSQPFLEAKRYDACVWGADPLRLTLQGGKYCWFFTTRSTPPVITNTNPSQGQIDVPLNADVVITFSEPMDTSTCWPYVKIDPSAVFDNHSWNPTDTVLTMTHSALFNQITIYTVEVPMDAARPCKDKSGVLLGFSPVANPWQFETNATDPYIVSTDPGGWMVEVPVNKIIKVTFSRDIQASSMSYAFKEYNGIVWSNSTVVLTRGWTNPRLLEFTHSTNFAYCKPYQMQIWALDTTGRQLIKNFAVRNPWKFETAGASGQCAPFMVNTMPADGELDVPYWENVTIDWFVSPLPPTGGMNPTSFTFSIKDSFSNELSSNFIANWPSVMRVELEHPAFQFQNCEEYTVRVLTARDNQNRAFIPGLADNPFKFKTISTDCAPYVVWTQPKHNAVNVPVSQQIKAKFNIPMNTSSVSLHLRPDAGTLNYSWSESNTNVTITHSLDFVKCTWYDATLIGLATNGIFIREGPIPNPWTFQAFCSSGTIIESTYPAAGQADIPWTASIYVNFSDPMDTTPSSTLFNLVPVAGSLSYAWTNGDKTLIINHSLPYGDCVDYTAHVVQARNKSGGAIVGGGAPNPWLFRSHCTPPEITNTTPWDGQKDVGLGDFITIRFSQPMSSASLDFRTTPPLVYSATWPDPQTVRLSHTVQFAVCQRYVAQVFRATNLKGVDLGPGPVPNPWNFTSDCRFPLRGLQVHRQPPNNVSLTWTSDPLVSYYWVYHSIDKFAPWPWPVIANVTTNQATISNHLSDMQNHFYVVRGYRPGAGSSNSTMGAIWHMQVAPNPSGQNAFWFSLPYNSIYKRASDIANELGSGKINIVGKWDSANQKSILYYYLLGRWRGTNFQINAGDGLWLGITSAFDWAVNGTDKTVSLVFGYVGVSRTHIYWIGLPFTGKIGDARDLVISIEGGTGIGRNTKIVAVGKWNYATQSSWVYSYSSMTGWGGNNFRINPGDGIWLEVVSTFAWTPELITPEIL